MILKKCQLDFELSYSTLILNETNAKNILNMLYQFVQNVIKHPDCTTGSLVNLPKKDCMKTTCTMQMMKNKTSLSERKRVVDTRAKIDIDNRHVRYRSKRFSSYKGLAFT